MWLLRVVEYTKQKYKLELVMFYYLCVWCIPFHSSLYSAAIPNSCWTPSFSYILCWSFLGWEIWPPYHKSVKVYYSVLLVYANLIFALLVCQSYKTDLVHRISILYHGDHNVDSNISSFIGAYAQLFISSCAQKIHTHALFFDGLAYVTNVWF